MRNQLSLQKEVGEVKSEVSLFNDILAGCNGENTAFQNRVIYVEAALTLLATGYRPDITERTERFINPLHEITHWIEESLNMGNNIPVLVVEDLDVPGPAEE